MVLSGVLEGRSSARIPSAVVISRRYKSEDGPGAGVVAGYGVKTVSNTEGPSGAMRSGLKREWDSKSQRSGGFVAVCRSTGVQSWWYVGLIIK